MRILAYVDPGLGALVWQTVVATFVGFVFYLKKTRRWLMERFLKFFGRGPKTPAAVESPEPEKIEAEIDPT